MSVRAKPVEAPTEVVLDAKGRLDAGVMSNRLHGFCGNHLPLSELFSYRPLICYECRRLRSPEQLTVGWDWFIRCLDVENCKRFWNGKNGEELAAAEKSPSAVSKKKPAPSSDAPNGAVTTPAASAVASKSKKTKKHRYHVKGK